MIMIIKMIEIYNIAAQPYYCWHTTSKQSHRAPHLHIYCLKEGASIPTRYSAVRINNCFKKNLCIQTIKVATTDNFRNKWKPSCIIDTFCGEQR